MLKGRERVAGAWGLRRQVNRGGCDLRRHWDIVELAWRVVTKDGILEYAYPRGQRKDMVADRIVEASIGRNVQKLHSCDNGKSLRIAGFWAPVHFDSIRTPSLIPKCKGNILTTVTSILVKPSPIDHSVRQACIHCLQKPSSTAAISHRVQHKNSDTCPLCLQDSDHIPLSIRQVA